MAHSLAGQLVRAEDLIQIQPLIDAYYDLAPNPKDKDQVVSFGTSGHRGVSTKGTFNDLHVACIVQAVCDLRHEFGAIGPCFVGQDTHALSQVAFQTALEVLAGNKVLAAVDQEMGFVPTPSISRAIIRYNEVHEGLADGLIITPSHNPPDNGGIKYNPTNGGPADTEMTKRIEELANLYLANYGEGIKRISVDNIEPEAQLAYDYKGLYVEELAQIIDMDAIKKAGLKVLVNGLGGSGAHYWQAISDHYDLGLTIINVDYDPTFSFMTYDHDGVVRMDCSSPYAMADVIKQIGSYDLAVGNDPDYDRYGVVTQEGLLNANYYLLTAAAYLFESRSWPSQVGVGKTAVVTSQVDAWAQETGRQVYEVPVGFKYFAPLLFDGRIGIGGEESAGASFLKKDGHVWTTDKDGIIMCLLAMEMLAKTGKNPAQAYQLLAAQLGQTYFGRIDAPANKWQKARLNSLNPDDLQTNSLAGDPILEVRTCSSYGKQPLGGLKVVTAKGWLVARPSGTEDLYKIYGESSKGQAGLEELLQEGQELVDKALN